MRVSYCTKCDTVFPAESKFCGFDRSALISRNQDGQPNLEVMACNFCGRTFPKKARFCANDGHALSHFVVPLDGQHQLLESKSEPAKATLANKAAAPTNVLTKEDVPKLPPPVVTQADTGTVMTIDQPKPGHADTILNVVTGELEPSLVGKTVDGKYKVLSLLAEGGMAVLYRANQMAMDREVVFKVVHSSLISKPSALARFEQESKIAAKISHPNVVAVFDFGFVSKNQPFLVMELIKGETLAERIGLEEKIPMEMAARIVSQICSGLEEIHQAGFIHRDLKPDNIILQHKSDRPDWVKILDFGIAHLIDAPEEKRLTQMGRIIGTPEYMSPEQFKGRDLDVRSDVYSLGVLIFETLTGDVPFESDDLLALMMAHASETAPLISSRRPDIKPNSKIDLCVARCLAKDPAARYESVSKLRSAFDEAVRDYM